MSVERLLIVGAGVSGLTTAMCLRREGFEVTVVAQDFAPNVTSVVAGALWELPPAICRQHEAENSLLRARQWSVASYEAFEGFARRPETGVYMRSANFYFRQPVETDREHLQKMSELRKHVRDLVHDPALILKNQVDPGSGVRDAYSFLAPVVDTDTYMNWLLREVRAAGCRVVQEKVNGSLRDNQERLKREHSANAIVNCSGLGAAELAGDDMYPVRGALIRLINNGSRIPKITQAHCFDSGASDSGFIFILPRGEDRLLLGGFGEIGQWGKELNLDYGPIRKIYERCTRFLPVLANAEFDPAEPVRIGLRPFRRGSVRLEHETGTSIIHNYGHGGAGVTLSWGCAQEVVRIAQSMLT